MNRRIVIKSGRVIDPLSGCDSIQNLYLAEGRIASVGVAPEGYRADCEINAEGLIVAPGFVDLSAHLREPGQEHKATIASETQAAVAAGVTTLCCPPDTQPVIDTSAVVNLVRERAMRAGKTRVLPIGALTRGLNGKDLSEMSALKEAGCLAVSNAYQPIANPLVLRRALEYAASYGLLIIMRPEDPHLADRGCVHEGAVGTRMGLPGIPHAAETVAVAEVLALVEDTGARVHFSQLSSARAVRMIARSLEKGIPVSADVAAHQLHLTDACIESFDPLFHLRPPLRSLEDRDALRQGVRDGVLAAICSSHQPHEQDAKLDAFPATEPGIAALETLLPLTLSLVESEILSLPAALAALSSRPAAILGLDTGRLIPGAPADICIFDSDATWIPSASTWHSRGQNTPYWGHTLKGRVIHTLIAGERVYSLGGAI